VLRIFLSYAREDEAQVQEIYRRLLKERSGSILKYIIVVTTSIVAIVVAAWLIFVIAPKFSIGRTDPSSPQPREGLEGRMARGASGSQLSVRYDHANT
jgi:prolipoprotein diacylglyceryltransferase